MKNLLTKQDYDELSHAYDFFNERLFGGTLSGCLFTLQRKSCLIGYFSFERFVSREDTKSDEIALNREYFATQPVEDALPTLVHEQFHQWPRRVGTPPQRGYYDWEFVLRKVWHGHNGLQR
ncbi:zinc metalloproteinase Mpr protein [Noviherbaspirillum sp. L7-7A]|uniref:zinc metalloproteinase Mpr protein n=1 Tax=Noviherbaspirillum sp. L7-7A TaxID=2850560 RepID=UPI001C2BD283|nr:zinc metalloproteinase Mpr protein [Noviherbaspirillum sp. L7-7A]MBV0881507.1 zinc metalloproteinase Mpr protein [Noviherbaspirillum sp. L7-7A]